jgi:chitin disaccharide deacetylase
VGEAPIFMDRALIVNADDFGLSPGVNAGVARTHEEGILTSASLMVRRPAAAEAAAYANRTPSLSVGLHVDLGEWIYRDGRWVAVYQTVAPGGDDAAVEREVAAQLDEFRRLMGRDPSHLDSHQHVHLHEPAIHVFSRIGARLGLPVRGLDARFSGELHGQDVHGTPIPDAVSTERMIEIIAALEPGVTELGCHPGIGADTGSVYDHERELEVEVLCDPRVAEALVREGVELRSFADVAAGGAGAR